MNWRTGRPPEDGWYWMEYDGGRKRMERYWVGDKYNNMNYAELVGWLGPLRPEDAEELEGLRATVVAKEKTLCHYEEQIAEDTQRIVELESQLATAREEIATLRKNLTIADAHHAWGESDYKKLEEENERLRDALRTALRCQNSFTGLCSECRELIEKLLKG